MWRRRRQRLIVNSHQSYRSSSHPNSQYLVSIEGHTIDAMTDRVRDGRCFPPPQVRYIQNSSPASLGNMLPVGTVRLALRSVLFHNGSSITYPTVDEMRLERTMAQGRIEEAEDRRDDVCRAPRTSSARALGSLLLLSLRHRSIATGSKNGLNSINLPCLGYVYVRYDQAEHAPWDWNRSGPLLGHPHPSFHTSLATFLTFLEDSKPFSAIEVPGRYAQRPLPALSRLFAPLALFLVFCLGPNGTERL